MSQKLAWIVALILTLMSTHAAAAEDAAAGTYAFGPIKGFRMKNPTPDSAEPNHGP
ncbi:hypothetical protein EST38_g11295 [Candolleomyces aberdarensis]|uniref:Uncharacterized protein n=1 Tax=Candolleomyces aberdarensis TaxID=2316362 RepID=A0A4Q2D8G9_9AGAR|nr:hypothetical protein EST38_g11295 [Candolleomyces aberdarensis]